MQLAGAVRGEDHGGRRAARTVPNSGIVTWKSESSSSRNASNSSSARSISSMSSTGGTRHRVLDRLQQRPPLQELAPKSSCSVSAGFDRVTRLQSADVEQLTRVVPVVEGVCDVDALVALEPDQTVAETAASADASSVLPTPASPSSRSGFPARARTARRQAAVGHVGLLAQRGCQLVDGGRRHRFTISAVWPAALSGSVDPSRREPITFSMPPSITIVVPGDIAAPTRQEGDQVGHLLRAPQPQHRDAAGDLSRSASYCWMPSVSIQPGATHDEGDVVLPPLDAERVGERAHAGPRRGRVRHAGDAAGGHNTTDTTRPPRLGIIQRFATCWVRYQGASRLSRRTASSRWA